ncbi:MAG TPA: polysaccharide deacetylase family protein [Phycisphaerae bacterium]|nr:polysaccharide deacetylase family protein [Phycisphaerae bacterium]HOJ75908.1 polysaccharide deacetylase family protein [Phycisphaerae bacterium]HOM52316.1 polysaccharide deacetylase family protein [Phycisphaerae bacterium]HON65658.1 polysaccharide deacetylase family protein [Phycisphaerae bacterium]HOQ84640.1 polysaccharide deacetylase family protein [Phycisphaerae bacterium]
MPIATDIKRELFAALSWRTEARAAGMTAERGVRMRDRVGHLMRWARAHDSLPEIENRAVILCFHGVVAHQPDPDVECEHVHVARFRQLLRVIRRSFHPLALAELVDCIRQRVSPPPKSVVITFDDGYANNAEVAAEELDRFRMPWSAFLPAQLIETGTYQWIDDVRLLVHGGGARSVCLPGDDGPLTLHLETRDARHEAVRAIHQLCRYVPDDVRRARLAHLYAAFPTGLLEELRARYRSFAPMTWEQARQLKSAGVDVGSHSLTHTALGPQSPEAIRHEVFAARALLQARIGEHCPHFSYPYGRRASLSQQTEAVLFEAGYNCALTLEPDVVRCDEVNLLQLPRLIVSPLIGRMVFNLWQRFLR